MRKNITFDCNPKNLTRQQRFLMWKAVSKASYAALSRCMGVSHVSVRNWCLGTVPAPADRVKQLKELGVPGDLLPEPSTGPGPWTW